MTYNCAYALANLAIIGHNIMKETIYLTIIDHFKNWAAGVDYACVKGCSPCCTQNVTITALEGERILNFVLTHGMERWLAKKLQEPQRADRPRLTTNEFAQACLTGREADDGENGTIAPCPFLEDDACRIYPVRPFACRCFISTIRCSALQPARIAAHYLTAATAMMQLIEHLGQKEYWGIMTDVLLALCDISVYRPIAEQLDDPARIMQGRLRTLTARPLPGFLFSEEEEERLGPLLRSIFSTHLDGRTVEDILNGK